LSFELSVPRRGIESFTVTPDGVVAVTRTIGKIVLPVRTGSSNDCPCSSEWAASTLYVQFVAEMESPVSQTSSFESHRFAVTLTDSVD